MKGKGMFDWFLSLCTHRLYRQNSKGTRVYSPSISSSVGEEEAVSHFFKIISLRYLCFRLCVWSLNWFPSRYSFADLKRNMQLPCPWVWQDRWASAKGEMCDVFSMRRLSCHRLKHARCFWLRAHKLLKLAVDGEVWYVCNLSSLTFKE